MKFLIHYTIIQMLLLLAFLAYKEQQSPKVKLVNPATIQPSYPVGG